MQTLDRCALDGCAADRQNGVMMFERATSLAATSAQSLSEKAFVAALGGSGKCSNENFAG